MEAGCDEDHDRIGRCSCAFPGPITNLTASQIVANSIAVDPVQVIGVNVGNLDSNGELGLIAGRTGGSVISGTSALTDTILEIFDATAKQPFAWVGQAYSGKIGEPIQFDASGSYDPSGFPISRYEWDFDGDGIFDLDTTEPSATHIYDMDFNDFVVLRVTSPGGTALASARAVVNSEGFASQGDEESCELDKNGYSIIVDESGIFIPAQLITFLRKIKKEEWRFRRRLKFGRSYCSSLCDSDCFGWCGMDLFLQSAKIAQKIANICLFAIS